MKRALFVVGLACALIGLAVFFAGRSRRGASAADGPVILISIDTLRADRLSAYGYTKIRTPNIDALAADGVLFENAYAHSPQTLPSHASLFSGTLPFEHGVRDNIGFSVKPDERMLPHLMKDRGYPTAGFVSSYVLRRQVGMGGGFDVYDDRMPPASPNEPLGELQRPGTQTAAAALDWIGSQGGSRFFLFFHIYDPHTPYAPSYDADVEQSDRVIGQLIAGLRDRDLYDGATIVLLSDHGEGLGDHGEEEHGIFLYRETTRVPLIVKLPRARRAGRRVAAAVQHIDVVPTLLAMTGSAPSGMRGRSLLPVIDGSGDLPAATIYSESLSPRYHYGWSELYALTDDRYRLIRAPRDELFDLAQDPGEKHSIAEERPRVRAAMRGALDALIANASVTAPSRVSSEDRQKLAALGYVGTQSSAPLETPGDTLPDPKDKIDVLRQYRRASALAAEGRSADAIAAYRALLAANPDMTDVWLQLAALYDRGGMPAGALEAYQQIIRRNPKDPAGLTGAAGALVQLGRFGEARTHAELAVDVAPAIAHELLARLALQRRDPDAARRHAKLASEADPTLPMPQFIEGLIAYNRGAFDAAVPHLMQASRALQSRTERVADVNFLLGDALARLERYPEAEAAFKAELAVFPRHIRARAGLAMLYAATGRPADAMAQVDEIVRLSPDSAGYATAAQLLTMFGQPARAAEMRARAR